MTHSSHKKKTAQERNSGQLQTRTISWTDRHSIGLDRSIKIIYKQIHAKYITNDEKLPHKIVANDLRFLSSLYKYTHTFLFQFMLNHTKFISFVK